MLAEMIPAAVPTVRKQKRKQRRGNPVENRGMIRLVFYGFKILTRVGS